MVSSSAPCFLSHGPSSAGCCGMLTLLSSGIKRSLILKKNANCEEKGRQCNEAVVQRSDEANWMKERRPESSRVQFLVVGITWTQPGSQSSNLLVEKMARLRWTCMICAFVCLYLNELLTHLNSNHRRDSNFCQKCGLPGCTTTDKEFTSVNSLVKHVRSKHRSLLDCTYDDACL